MSNEIRFTKEHEWVVVQEAQATVGITDYAQNEMGDVTFVELPTVGKTVKQNDELGVIESVKAASDLFAPVGGTVAEVNKDLENTPELINSDPLGKGWICRLKDIDLSGLNSLMSQPEYEKFIAG